MFARKGQSRHIDPKGAPMNSATPSSPDAAHHDPEEPVWGAPPPRRGWSRRQTLAAVGVAAVIAGFGGAAIYAATSGGSHEMDPGIHGFGPAGPGPRGPGPWDGPGSAGDPGRGPNSVRGRAAPLHGEFVVPDDNGGYTTVLTQTGVITAASDTSITAKSADGSTQTYTIAPGSPAANAQLAVNDTVTVHATIANGTATATMVAEGNDAGRPRPR
jgi:hypothetical protein